jgi:hypothetical protein
VGRVADSISLSAAFILPMLAYVFITGFALKARNAKVLGSGDGLAAVSH